MRQLSFHGIDNCALFSTCLTLQVIRLFKNNVILERYSKAKALLMFPPFTKLADFMGLAVVLATRKWLFLTYIATLSLEPCL